MRKTLALAAALTFSTPAHAVEPALNALGQAVVQGCMSCLPARPFRRFEVAPRTDLLLTLTACLKRRSHTTKDVYCCYALIAMLPGLSRWRSSHGSPLSMQHDSVSIALTSVWRMS